MEEDKERSLKDEIKELNRITRESLEKKKVKGFKLPLRARVGKAKLRKGYIIVEVLNENKNVDFTRLPIIDGTIKIGDTYHAVESLDIFEYKGKPLLIMPKNKLNPYNPIDGKNETYGQKYVMARLQSDTLKDKKGIGNLGWIIFILILVGAVAYYFLK